MLLLLRQLLEDEEEPPVDPPVDGGGGGYSGYSLPLLQISQARKKRENDEAFLLFVL